MISKKEYEEKKSKLKEIFKNKFTLTKKEDDLFILSFFAILAFEIGHKKGNFWAYLQKHYDISYLHCDKKKLINKDVYEKSYSTVHGLFKKYALNENECVLVFEDISVNCFSDMCEKDGPFVSLLLNIHILIDIKLKKTKIMKTKNFMPCFIAMLIASLFGAGCGGSGEKKETLKEKEVIKIGAILPLTGPASSAGTDSQNGLLLAIQVANDSELIPDKIIELIIEDSKAQAKDAVTAINKINLSQKPKVIYSQLSSVSLAIKPITEENKQILIAVSGANNLTEGSPTTYRNYINPSHFASTAAQIIKDSLDVKEIGIFYANTEFGKSIKEHILKGFISNNIQVSFEELYDEHSDDFKSFILKTFSKHKVKNIYVIGVGKSLGLLIKQVREMKYAGLIIGGIETPYPDVLNIAGKSADGIFYIDFAFNASSQSQKTKEFVKYYETKFNKTPTTSSAIAFDAINILFKAIKEQNINSSINLNILKYPVAGVAGNISVTGNNFYYELTLKKLEIK